MHRRTAMITAGSIAVVALTGAIAVGANIGILASAGASDLGALTAVAEVETIEFGPVLAAPSVESPAAPLMTSQEFEADEAGVVEVLFSADELRLGSVHPASGWTWSSDQADGKGLFVKFQSDDGKELEFVAELLPDGTLTAKVDETIIRTIHRDAEVITVHTQAPVAAAGAATVPEPSTVVPQAWAAPPAPTAAQSATMPLRTEEPGSSRVEGQYDDDDDEEFDQHDDEYDEYEDDEYEDDDDEYEDDEYEDDEYEGADDDD